MKRTASTINALLAIDKPVGMTSHDVVSHVRRALHEKRVGHAGTLDPLASGVLIVGVGLATRLLGMLTLAEKCYRATISFGVETETDDSEGAVVKTAPVPSELFDSAYAKHILEKLVGEHEQIPPRFSAVSVGGKRAYALAREGKAPELAARYITIYQAQLVSIERDSQADSLASNTCLWVVDFCVSKGTYIRSIARDLGRELGCGAHISALRRVVSGTISLADCVELALFEERGGALWSECCLNPVRALELPIRQVSSQELADVLVGRHIAAGEVEETDKGTSRRMPLQQEKVAIVHDRRLFGVWYCHGSELICKANFPQGISGVTA